jgi:hypothetical protein
MEALKMNFKIIVILTLMSTHLLTFGADAKKTITKNTLLMETVSFFTKITKEKCINGKESKGSGFKTSSITYNCKNSLSLVFNFNESLKISEITMQNPKQVIKNNRANQLINVILTKLKQDYDASCTSKISHDTETFHCLKGSAKYLKIDWHKAKNDNPNTAMGFWWK